jgi:DNA-binding transcriptional LysR family regulator
MAGSVIDTFIRASHPGFELCRYIVPLIEVGRPRQRKTAASARSATTVIALRRGWRYPGVDVLLIEDESAQECMSTGELDAVLIYSNHLVAGVASEEIAPVRLQLASRPPTG